jgi:hypothetical protein
MSIVERSASGCPEVPIGDSEMAVGVVCRRTGWWGSPEGAKRASGVVRVLARVIARASRCAALLVASRHAPRGCVLERLFIEHP